MFFLNFFLINKMKKILIIVICLLLSALLAISLKNSWKKNRILQEELSILEKQKFNLIEEQGELKQIMEEGKIEENLEREARLTLGFKKEGEEVILIVPPSLVTSSVATSSPQQSVRFSLSNIKQIWYNFKQLIRKI